MPNEYLKIHLALIAEVWSMLSEFDPFEVEISDRYGKTKKYTFEGEETGKVSVYYWNNIHKDAEDYWMRAEENVTKDLFISLFQKPWLYRVKRMRDDKPLSGETINPTSEYHHLYLNDKEEMWIRSITGENIVRVPRTNDTDKVLDSLMVMPRFQFLCEENLNFEENKKSMPSIETLSEYFSEKRMKTNSCSAEK